VGNFDVNAQVATIDFDTSGLWMDALGGANITLATTQYSATIAPGAYHIFSRQTLN
jgi:hypothetical protein